MMNHLAECFGLLREAFMIGVKAAKLIKALEKAMQTVLERDEGDQSD